MLALLLLIYTCNFVDRTILATLAQAIKLDLKISDTQLGLLQGLAFALFYTSLGIPLARAVRESQPGVADRDLPGGVVADDGAVRHRARITPSCSCAASASASAKPAARRRRTR